MKQSGLASALRSQSIESIMGIEERKANDIEEAHTREEVAKSTNRIHLGQYFITWFKYVFSLCTAIFIMMFFVYAVNIVGDNVKLSAFLTSSFNYIESAIIKYQAVIAVVATIMIGDKFKIKAKPQ